MRKFLIALTLSSALSLTANAQFKADGGSEGLLSSSLLGGTLGLAAMTYYPLLSLSLGATSVGTTCYANVDTVKDFFICLVAFPIELTKVAAKSTSNALSGNYRKALIEAAQQDLLDVVAGNGAKYAMVQDLIIYQQQKFEKEQRLILSKEDAAVEVYNDLEILKND